MKIKYSIITVTLMLLSFLTLPHQTTLAATRRVTPTPTPTPASNNKLGGMNLDGYCNSINKPGVALNNNIWYCANGAAAINMNTACQWQYNQNTAIAKQDTPGNPYTWACYSSTTNVTPTPTPIPTQISTPTPAQSQPTPTPTATPNTNYYMALGDSFAFGFHLVQYQQEQASNSYSPASFNDGYDADFFSQLKAVISPLQEINYSCPGETTDTFINGGCPNHTNTLPLHTNYPVSQSQLQAAVNFLQSNSNNVKTITIDIGVNDAINLANLCQPQSTPVQCYNTNTQGVLNKVQQNYDTILTSLRQAAPQANIIIVKFPNPVYYDGTDALGNGLNQIQDNEATSRGLKLADTFSIFNANNLCSYTNFCSTPSDFHPTALGYNAMANQIWSASGYAK